MKLQERMRFLIIGAGASGIVTAKILLEADPSREILIVEKNDYIGGTFVNKRYSDSRMVSSKFLTMFSDFRADKKADDHLTLKDYVQYLEDYADANGIRKLIQFQTEVLSLSKKSDRWQAVLRRAGSKEIAQTFDAVAVCSGLHNFPKIPAFRGQKEYFRGKVIHSCDYKEPSIMAKKRVLVLGTGETAFDIGYQAAKHGAKSVTMATRNGFVSVPSAFHGTHLPPLDCLIMNIGTHCWESDWSARVSFHWWVTTKLQRLGLAAMTGTTAGFNQWAGKHRSMTWDQGHKHIVNKSSRCMPLINRGVKGQIRNPVVRWLNANLFAMWDEPAASIGLQLGEKGIQLIEGKQIERFGTDGESIHFEPITRKKSGSAWNSDSAECRNEIIKADLVVLATGYRQYFPFISRTMNSNVGNGQSGCVSDDPLPSEHFIVDPKEPCASRAFLPLPEYTL